MISLSKDAQELLDRVYRLRRVYVPRLESPHFELIKARLISYFSHDRGYWISQRKSDADIYISRSKVFGVKEGWDD